MSADGIYSILGLLPYGNKINPEYKDNNNKEKSLDGVLVSVMKAAVENGYGEPLAWYGEGNSNSPGQCWLPKIEENRVSIE